MQGFQIRAKDRGFETLDEQHEGVWAGEFTFVQAADTQFGMIDSFENHNPNPGWDAEIKLFGELIRKVNKMDPKPRFLVVCGDLVDAMPGTKIFLALLNISLGVPAKAAQIRDFKQVISGLHPDVKAVCVCGNHDVGNVPTPDTIREYKEEFGEDFFSFWVGGCKFLVLNAQLFHNATKAPGEQR